MGELGCGDWYCRIPGELMDGRLQPELCISSRGEGVCGVARGAVRSPNGCRGQVRREGGTHLVDVKAWCGHAAWGKTSICWGSGVGW